MSDYPLTSDQRFFAPEIIQTSAMDCGPAALKCLLEGFGIAVSYGRLREACQTDVDGTSIDTLEDVAQQLGLAAEQMIAPVDHLLTNSANLLPALVVVRLPDGLPHFVIVWRVFGPFVQIMDPATGRHWRRRQHLLRDLYRHAIPFPAADWRAWAGEEGFCEPLRQRLQQLAFDDGIIERLLSTALADPHWHALAMLDAAARFVETLAAAGGVDRGSEAAQLLDSLLQQVDEGDSAATSVIPSAFWFVQRLLPSRTQQEQMVEQLLLRGAVLIRVQGKRLQPPLTPIQDGTINEAESSAPPTAATPTPLSPALLAALAEAPSRPEWELLRLLRADGWLTPTLILTATTLAAASITVEALLFRGLMNLATPLAVTGQRMVLLGVCLFTLFLLLLELPLTDALLRMGRRLEIRLRMALLQKLPRLGDQYFRSRLISDVATRAHGLHNLHTLPDLALRTVRLAVQLLLTAAGIIWLHPASAAPALLATGFAIGAALLTQPMLGEQDMRVRTHAGALSRFYLDALLGLTPVRTHSAARAVRREHEMRLTAWVRAQLAFQNLQRLIQIGVALMGAGFAIVIILTYLTTGGEASGVLLLLYWALALPTLGQALVSSIQQYPLQRNHVLRLLEPLGAPDEQPEGETGRQGDKETRGQGDKEIGGEGESKAEKKQKRKQARKQRVANKSLVAQLGTATLPKRGVAIRMEKLTVSAGGHLILSDLDLSIGAGEHVAIVGASGAGKSTLVGLLLGWQRPTGGDLLVDGAPLTGERLAALRRATAWVDPSVQLWNRTLLENLSYGVYPSSAEESNPANPATVGASSDDARWAAVWEAADLYAVLDKLPGGLQARLGESGGLVSGGEGQRVRLGRALFRSGVRLAILDEPFRGLDRTKRHQLLANARQHWQAATLLCVTHDISATQDFARVLVLADGQIVEDGAPALLAAQPDSRYRALLAAETAVQRTLWAGTTWRRLWLADGQLVEQEADHEADQKAEWGNG